MMAGLPGRRYFGLAALAVSLLASGALLWTHTPVRDPGGPLTVGRAWPRAKIIDSPGQLPDGTAYTPLHHLDALTDVGTAPTTDSSAIRLVLRGAKGDPRELRRVPQDANPQFGGFAVAGDDLVWAESTTGADGRGETRLWHWRPGQTPTDLTADTGDAVFFNSQYDLVIADGRVYWLAAARSATPKTEVRSVPLTGGAVSAQTVDGAYALSAWPWLVSAGTGQTGPVELRNVLDGRRVAVPAQATELVSCSPAWCRVLVLSGVAGPARIDLMKPDGSDRRKVAGGFVSASVSDVAVLDRFEVLTLAGRDGSATSNQQLMLYDAPKKRTVLVANGVGTVLCRAGILWWSTGDNESLTWHTLDLRALSR